MNSFYAFDFRSKGAGRPKRIAVVFCSQELRIPTLMDKLLEFMDSTIPPDQLILLGSSNIGEELLSVSQNETFLAKLPAATRHSDPPIVRCCVFVANGTVEELFFKKANRELSKELVQQLKFAGLRTVFTNRGGILESSPAHHFIKPSKAHSAQFIRTANVLVSSAETNFIAFCLLPFLKTDTSHIYCDTASINSLAYAVVHLRQNIDKTFPFVTVDSFGSYEGLRTFRFHGLANSLILISASTSNKLVRKLLDMHRIDASRIVTLFLIGHSNTHEHVLADLTKRAANASGFDAIINYEAENCPLCQRGSTPIEILGDQFLAGDPKISPYTVKQTDVPAWLNPLMKQLAGKGLVRCYFDELAPNKAREIHIDLSTIFHKSEKGLQKEFPEIASRFHKILTQSLPASLSRIIHLEGKSSIEMAHRVKEHFLKYGGVKRKIELKSSKDVSNFSPKNVRDTGSTLVVASCVVSGRSLMAISQFLRNIQTNGAITFLIGLSRTRNRLVLDEIRNNVCYGKYGVSDYGFFYVNSIFLPDDPPLKLTSWDSEIELLKLLRETYRNRRGFPNNVINDRIQTIQSASDPAKRGLVENLFWNAHDGHPLKARKNIAFFDFQKNFSQADIYLAISATLHSLRQEGNNEAPLLQRGYQVVLLSPHNFSRFNDGAIQAAFLRAAHRAELNYSASSQASRNMAEVLHFVFSNIDNEQGEATGEFLLALADHRLRLRFNDTKELMQLLKRTPKLPKLFGFLADYISVNCGRDS